MLGYEIHISNMLKSIEKDGGETIMADGSEEREEARKRRELEERENREDRLERERRDEGEPERGGS
jgi:hypothetical protein